MKLETLKGPLARALAANATDSTFPSRIPTLTQPALAIGDLDGNIQQNGLLVMPFAIGADNETFSMRLIQWRYIGSGPQAYSRLWVPTVLAEFACTLCAAVGVASSPVLNTERFCDTITLVGSTGNANISHEIVSPGNDTIAYILLDLKGAHLWEPTFDIGTGPTSMNALYALM